MLQEFFGFLTIWENSASKLGTKCRSSSGEHFYARQLFGKIIEEILETLQFRNFSTKISFSRNIGTFLRKLELGICSRRFFLQN